MKIYKNIFLIVSASIFLACGEDTIKENLSTIEVFLFEDGFETQNGQLEELFPSDGSRWSTIQKTDPLNATNEISISTTKFSGGQHSLRMFANKSDAVLSKIDIEKNGLNIQSGDSVTIMADFYISGTAPLPSLLLIDLECCSCWDPNVGDNYGSENQCPGVRLMMSGAQDYLSIERGKISGTTLQQTNLPFPRNRWVSVKWEMTLSDSDNGQNKLTIDGVEVINENAMNMPNAQVFSDFFANEGITFNLQQPTFYERVQIGATANPLADNVELFIDNFSINVKHHHR